MVHGLFRIFPRVLIAARRWSASRSRPRLSFRSDRRTTLLGLGAAPLALVAERALAGEAAVGAATPRSSRAFNVLEFGATGDGIADDRNAIAAAIAAALAHNGSVYLPAGFTFGIDAAKGALEIDIGHGKTFVMAGDGPTSIVKRLDVGSPVNGQKMFRLVAKGGDGGSAAFAHFLVDDNARGSPLSDPKDTPYELEHSHIFFLTEGPAKIGRVVFDQVWFTDPVADCISCGRADGKIIVDTISCTNVQVLDRQRVRSDITVTGGLRYLLVDNFRGFSLEAELNADPEETIFLQISNSITKRLDLGGHTRPNLIRAKLANVVAYGDTLLGIIHLDAVNCEFRMVKKPRLYAMGSHSSLVNCVLRLPLQQGQASPTTTPLQWHVQEKWRERYEVGGQPTYEHVLLKNCRIMIDNGDEASPIDFLRPEDGALLDKGNGVPWSWSGENMPTIEFDGCYFDRRAGCIASAPRGGRWIFRGCQMAGTFYAFRYVSHPDYVTQLEFYDCDWSNVGKTIIEFGAGDGAKGNYLRWSQRFMDADQAQKLSRGSGSSTYKMGTHISDRRIVSSSPPDEHSRCLRGDVWVRLPAVQGAANEWIAAETVADEAPTRTQWLPR